VTTSDLDTLERMLVQAGAGTADEIVKVRSGNGLGLFVRSMVGLDREAAKCAFDGFLNGKTLSANQIQFVNLVIDYLTQAGWMNLHPCGTQFPIVFLLHLPDRRLAGCWNVSRSVHAAYCGVGD
jgi:type I site-specific restriction endonuclease